MSSLSTGGISRIPPEISFEPYLPKPGETLKVDVALAPKQIQKRTSLTITLEDAESGTVILKQNSPLIDKTAESFTVSLELPFNMVPGLYRVFVADPRKGQVVASEELVIIDAATEETFRFEELGLQTVIEAVSKEEEQNFEAAASLFERAAMYYERAGSYECAGLTLADAAFTWSKLKRKKRAVTQGWRAAKLLMMAEDSIGAAPLVTWLTNSAPSLPNAVAQYIEVGSSVVTECESEFDVHVKKLALLEIAKKALPQGEGFRFNLGAVLDAMSSSRGNIFHLTLDRLISLATSEQAIYSPGVLMRTERGIAVRCATFIDEFVDNYVAGFQGSSQKTLELARAKAEAQAEVRAQATHGN